MNNNEDNESTSEKKKDLDKVLYDQLERLLNLFDRKYKYFQSVFYVSLGFALFFFFLSILPYIFIQKQYYNINLQMKQLDLNASKIRHEINQMMAIRSIFANMTPPISNPNSRRLKYIHKIWPT
jgi:hypothetical protein